MERPQDAWVWAQWLLLSLEHEADDELVNIPGSIRAGVRRIAERSAAAGRNLDLEIIGGDRADRYRS